VAFILDTWCGGSTACFDVVVIKTPENLVVLMELRETLLFSTSILLSPTNKKKAMVTKIIGRARISRYYVARSVHARGKVQKFNLTATVTAATTIVAWQR